MICYILLLSGLWPTFVNLAEIRQLLPAVTEDDYKVLNGELTEAAQMDEEVTRFWEELGLEDR